MTTDFDAPGHGAGDQAPQTLLITLTGKDRPGVTSAIFSALSGAGVEVIDIEQIVLRRRLVLGVLVTAPRDWKKLRASVEACAADLGMSVEVDRGHGDNTARKDGRSHVTIIGSPLRASAMAAMAGRIADAGANIDRIERMARYPVTAHEGGISYVIIPNGATAELRTGATRKDLAQLNAEGALSSSSSLPGGLQYRLGENETLRVKWKGFTFQVKAMPAGKRVGAALKPDWTPIAYIGGVAAFFGVLFMVAYFALPNVGQLNGDQYNQTPLLETADEGAVVVRSMRDQLIDARVRAQNPWNTYGPLQPSRWMEFGLSYAQFDRPSVGVPPVGWGAPPSQTGCNAAVFRGAITFTSSLDIKSLRLLRNWNWIPNLDLHLVVGRRDRAVHGAFSTRRGACALRRAGRHDGPARQLPAALAQRQQSSAHHERVERAHGSARRGGGGDQAGATRGDACHSRGAAPLHGGGARGCRGRAGGVSRQHDQPSQ